MNKYCFRLPGLLRCLEGVDLDAGNGRKRNMYISRKLLYTFFGTQIALHIMFIFVPVLHVPGDNLHW